MLFSDKRIISVGMNKDYLSGTTYEFGYEIIGNGYIMNGTLKIKGKVSLKQVEEKAISILNQVTQ